MIQEYECVQECDATFISIDQIVIANDETRRIVKMQFNE